MSIRGPVLYSIAVLLLAVMDLCAKKLTGEYGVSQITLIRALISFLPILIYYQWESSRGRVRTLATQWLALHLLRGVFFSLTFILFVVSLNWLPLADATGISLAGPVFIVILGCVLLKEDVNWRQWLSVAVGLAGVSLILQPEGGWPVFAGFIALASAFFFALVVILSRKLSADDPPITISFWANLVMLVLACAGLALQGWESIPPGDMPVFLLLGLSGGISSILFIVALKMHAASKMAVLEYSIFIWAVVFGAVFFAETPGSLVYLGMLLIFLGGIFSAQRERMPTGSSD